MIKRNVLPASKNKKEAFTLAEVLITLGIIGIVAALTMPTLIQNTNNKKFSAQLKKSISTLSQAGRSAQAHFDMNYAALTSDSEASTCESESLSAGNYTICGLLNETLSGKSYVGIYGSAGRGNSTYSFTKTTEGFEPANYLMFQLSDGTVIGVNPASKNCNLPTGTMVNHDNLTGSLSQCIGFVDVNGFTLPNKEATCSDGTSTLDPNASCTVTKSNALGDVYPVVFHNGTVEAATNAGRVVSILYGNNGASSDAEGGANGAEDDTTAQNTPRKTVMYKGNEYEYIAEFDNNKGGYFRIDEDGNIIQSNGNIYTKTADGYYQNVKYGDTYLYDENMNPIKKNHNGRWYDAKCTDNYCIYLRDYTGKGDYVTDGSSYLSKQPDGTYKYYSDTLDADFKILGRYTSDGFYEYKNGFYCKDLGNGNYLNSWGSVWTKQSDGTYKSETGEVFDKDFKRIGIYKNGVFYEERFFNNSQVLVRKDENGDYVGYTKRPDGYYELNGYLYDEEVRPIGPVN